MERLLPGLEAREPPRSVRHGLSRTGRKCSRRHPLRAEQLIPLRRSEPWSTSSTSWNTTSVGISASLPTARLSCAVVVVRARRTVLSPASPSPSKPWGCGSRRCRRRTWRSRGGELKAPNTGRFSMNYLACCTDTSEFVMSLSRPPPRRPSRPRRGGPFGAISPTSRTPCLTFGLILSAWKPLARIERSPSTSLHQRQRASQRCPHVAQGLPLPPPPSMTSRRARSARVRIFLYCQEALEAVGLRE